MSDYKTYLAASLFTEQKSVTYRLLSRALKIHVNVAKEMLYEFHREQNIRKPGSIHAVYFVSGFKTDDVVTDISNGREASEENFIQSSPLTNCSSPIEVGHSRKSSVKTITLAREEDLEEIRSKYDKIDSIYVYSIGPYLVKDLQVLSDVTRELRELCSDEDLLKNCSTYGIILNKNVRRRNRSKTIPILQNSSTKPIASSSKSAINDDKSMATVNKKAKPTQLTTSHCPQDRIKTKSASVGTINSQNEIRTNPIQSSKHNSTNIFSAFSKAEPKIKIKQTDNVIDKDNIPIMGNDSPMKDISSGDEETWVPAPGQTENTDCNLETIEKRKEALKKMMDDDIEDEKGVGDEGVPSRIDSKSTEKSKLPEIHAKIEDQTSIVNVAKKRSRRRITKKMTFKDEEGYLVTKEEQAWESFSEDERIAKPQPKAQLSATNLKSKKGNSGKSGQGNIMSFFGKK